MDVPRPDPRLTRECVAPAPSESMPSTRHAREQDPHDDLQPARPRPRRTPLACPRRQAEALIIANRPPLQRPRTAIAVLAARRTAAKHERGPTPRGPGSAVAGPGPRAAAGLAIQRLATVLQRLCHSPWVRCVGLTPAGSVAIVRGGLKRASDPHDRRSWGSSRRWTTGPTGPTPGLASVRWIRCWRMGRRGGAAAWRRAGSGAGVASRWR
jgi:hypothetical protein